MLTKSLYERLCEAGCEVDHHESDLYVREAAEAEHALLEHAKETGCRPARSYFRSAVDGKRWIDLPFAYTPFWDHKLKG